jgi:pimeloyl-ACP methyl ester carboxylesterase
MPSLQNKTFILCHGAWHGGWCWQAVAPALRALGAEVHTPTMTGMGERAHLRAACTGLKTYIDDVATLITHHDLSDIILVGHSFAGMCITAIADLYPDRIAHLVYLDAVLPRDGESLITQNITNPPDVNAAVQADLSRRSGEWLPPPPLERLGLDHASDAVRALEQARMTDHPVSSLIDVVRFVNGGPRAPATFIVCDNPPMAGTSFAAHHARVAAGDYGPRWTARRIATSHMCMLTAPDETTALLAEAALRN